MYVSIYGNIRKCMYCMYKIYTVCTVCMVDSNKGIPRGQV
jgi:hypothetical protein